MVLSQDNLLLQTSCVWDKVKFIGNSFYFKSGDSIRKDCGCKRHEIPRSLICAQLVFFVLSSNKIVTLLK
jgi:hypothetical protein